jgi:predicted PurR-regulated permease PerM
VETVGTARQAATETLVVLVIVIAALALCGAAVGLSPLVVLVSVVTTGYLLGPIYVLIAIPIAAIASTLVDVVVRGLDPAEEEAPAVLLAGTGKGKR